MAARYPFVSIDEEHDWRVVQVCEVRCGVLEQGSCQNLGLVVRVVANRGCTTLCSRTCQGSLGFDETGVVQKLAVPLAQANITVAYLST